MRRARLKRSEGAKKKRRLRSVETNLDKVHKEAFDWGRRVGFRAGEVNAELEPSANVDEVFSDWQDNFTQGADYVNFILPELRKMAGCRDYAGGTYTDCTDEQNEIYHELLDKFFDGAFEGFKLAFKKAKKGR